MAPLGRPRKFDEEKRRQYCALVTVGCSRRKAARFVGVTPAAVRQAARRDADFGELLRRAEMNREVLHLQNIRDAGARTWRASAWMLERINPDDFRLREPRSFSVDDVKTFLEGIGEIIATAIPSEDVRQDVLGRLRAVLRGPSAPPTDEADPSPDAAP
ncbi:MAG TPA: hypothetical protein VHZ24_15125 [Pirellulales bacterium]|jgi:hypothetical protein|nr:hypothetical protein [Pirellulales bacterium]